MQNLILFAFVGVIVFFLAMGLCLWLTGLSVAAGATFFGIGAAAAVGWFGASVATNMIVDSPLPKSYEMTIDMKGHELVDLLTGGGRREWRSLSETRAWYNKKCCHSRAIYTKVNDHIQVVNVCEDKHGNQIDMIEGKAYTTHMAGTLSVSFFPGIVAPLIVRDQGKGYMIVTNRDNTAAWLLYNYEAGRIFENDLKGWRKKFSEIVNTSNYVQSGIDKDGKLLKKCPE